MDLSLQPPAEVGKSKPLFTKGEPRHSKGWLAQIHGKICSKAGEGTWFLVSGISILIPNPPFPSHSHEQPSFMGISAVIACPATSDL